MYYCEKESLKISSGYNYKFRNLIEVKQMRTLVMHA